MRRSESVAAAPMIIEYAFDCRKRYRADMAYGHASLGAVARRLR